MAHIGDTLFSSNAMIKLIGVTQDFDKKSAGFDSTSVAVKAILEVKTMKGEKYFAEPAFGITQNMIVPAESEVKPLGLKFRFDKIDTETGQLQISIAEKKTNSKEFIILKAIEFPYINVLWIGCLLLIIGSSIAVSNRIKLNLARN
jgi:cytochrome c-type biogenesis protein CcmF